MTARKTIVPPGGRDQPTPPDGWLDLDVVARVEVTSEDAGHPVESALATARGPGWWAAGPGSQTGRRRFEGGEAGPPQPAPPG